MGKIIATIKVVNLKDEFLASEGYLAPSQIRSIEAEAVADSGATRLCLKKSVIE